jgi:hypothetical protein
MYTRNQLDQLKAFLDANAGTYSALTDQIAAETMNALTEVRIRSSMSGSEVAASIDATEYDALSSTDKGVILSLCAVDSMSPANGGLIHQTIASILGNNVSAASIIAARDESVTPAQVEGLPRVRADYVRIARTL